MSSSASGRSASSTAQQQAGRPKGPATLAPFLRHLRGLVVTVELKSGRSLRGILDEADSFMNLVLRKDTSADDREAQASSSGTPIDDGDDRPFDKVHIRGPLVRYIHFPRADLARLIKDGTDRERRARDKYKRNIIRKKGEQR